MSNVQNLVFVSQSGVADELVESMVKSNLTLFGLGYVISIPPSQEGESWDLSSPQTCGGKWWRTEGESLIEFAQRLLSTDMGTDPYDPEKEYGVQYWLIGFDDPTNPNEEPTLIHKVWEGKY
jgi:hypothetical protein